jgi:hypothetical protein
MECLVLSSYLNTISIFTVNGIKERLSVRRNRGLIVALQLST